MNAPISQGETAKSPKRARVAVAHTAAELGIELFKAGFHEISRAKSLLAVIDVLAQDTRVSCSETFDRLQLTFAYLSNPNAANGPGISPNTNECLDNLYMRLRMCSFAYTLEHTLSPEGCIGYVTLTIIKQRNLAVLDTRGMSWSRKMCQLEDMLAALQQEHKGNLVATPLAVVAQDNPLALDAALIRKAISAHARATATTIPGYWNYTEAVWREPSRAFRQSPAYYLVQTYPKSLHERYRFILTHQLDGQTRVEFVRH